MKTITGVLVALLLVSGICMADKAQHLYYQGYLAYFPSADVPFSFQDPYEWSITIENNVGVIKQGAVPYVEGLPGAFYSIGTNHYFAQLYSPVVITVVLLDWNYEPIISASSDELYWGPEDYYMVGRDYFHDENFQLP